MWQSARTVDGGVCGSQVRTPRLSRSRAKREKREGTGAAAAFGRAARDGPARAAHAADGGNGDASALFELRSGAGAGLRPERDMPQVPVRIALLQAVPVLRFRGAV